MKLVVVVIITSLQIFLRVESWYKVGVLENLGHPENKRGKVSTPFTSPSI